MSKSSLNFIHHLLLISQQYSKINRQLNLTDFKKYFFLQQISHVKQYFSEKWQLTMAMIPCTEYYGQPEYFLFSFYHISFASEVYVLSENEKKKRNHEINT